MRDSAYSPNQPALHDRIQHRGLGGPEPLVHIGKQFRCFGHRSRNLVQHLRFHSAHCCPPALITRWLASAGTGSSCAETLPITARRPRPMWRASRMIGCRATSGPPATYAALSKIESPIEPYGSLAVFLDYTRAAKRLRNEMTATKQVRARLSKRAHRHRCVDQRRPGSSGASVSRIVGSSLSGLFTRVEIGHIAMRPAGNGTSKSRGSGSMDESHRSQDSVGMITGIRSCMSLTSSLAVVVITAKVRTQASPPGFCQFSQMPASANGLPDFMAMAKGCLALVPLIAFHSKKLSTGNRHLRRRYASRKVGRDATVSPLALIGLRPPLASLHQ